MTFAEALQEWVDWSTAVCDPDPDIRADLSAPTDDDFWSEVAGREL